MIDQADDSRLLSLLSAIADGDRVVTSEPAALVLGVPLRTFQKLAARPDFPRPAKMGKRLTWRRRELLDWWEKERARQNRAA